MANAVEALVGTDVTEVCGGSTVECPSIVTLECLYLWNRRAQSLTCCFLEDMDGTLFSNTLGHVSETHVVCQSVYDSSLRRRQVGWQDENVPSRIFLEDTESSVLLKDLGVVEVDVCSSQQQNSRYRQENNYHS